VEDELTAGGFELSVKVDREVKKVFLAPDGEALDFRKNGEYITVTVPTFTGFGMLVFE
jgi:hypothetical protein